LVVAVGLMVVEPLADVEVNVPGVIAILVAPVAAQSSALLVPESMLVGSAVKEVIVGPESFPGDALGEPHPVSPKQANRTKASAEKQKQEQRASRFLKSFRLAFPLATGSLVLFT
jgi:hypothetical protein